MKVNKKLILETTKNVYGDTSDISGGKLANETFKLVSSTLVYKCDIFYNALLEDRKAYYKKYYELNKDSIRATLETQNKISNNLRDAKYYHLRGCDYFNLQDFYKAVRDLDSAEILDKKFFKLNIFYKAQIAEILEQYDEAIKNYEIFSKDQNWYLFHLYADMLRRKKATNISKSQNQKTTEDVKFNELNDSAGLAKKIAITTCIKGIMQDSVKSKTWSKKTAESYCTCAVENLYTKGYTLKDLGHDPNQNNKLYNEVIAPCFNQALKDGTEINSLNRYRSEDIVGAPFSSKVSLLDYFNQGYKIKISVSGKAKYYLFDTGASDLIIDRDFERELLLNGGLKKEDYLGTEFYTLANKQKVEVQLIRLNDVKVGDYTVKNVTAAIFDGSFLICGKSFLEKFRKWEFDAEQKVLTLFK